MTPPAELPVGAVPAQRHPEAPAPGQLLTAHYALCVGCGSDHPTGLHLVVTAGEGVSVSGTFVVTANHQGAPGLAHGGMLALAFDEVLGSLSWLLREPCVTARLETDFRRPVPVGSRLFIDARIDGRVGRRLFVSADGHLDAPDGPVAVRAAAVFVIVALEHFLTNGRAEDVAAVVAARSATGGRFEFEVNP